MVSIPPSTPLCISSTEQNQHRGLSPNRNTLLQHWTAFTEGSGEGAMGWEAPGDSCQLHSLLCEPVISFSKVLVVPGGSGGTAQPSAPTPAQQCLPVPARLKHSAPSHKARKIWLHQPGTLAQTLPDSFAQIIFLLHTDCS